MGSQTIRVPITVKLFDSNTKEVLFTASSAVKTKVRNLTSEALAKNKNKDVFGGCEVMYSRKNDSWNAFHFKTMTEFDEKIGPVLELNMLRELKADGMLEKKYLG